MANYSYRYPKLNDATWLRRKYVVEKLGTNIIAKLAGARTANSARQALLRAHIPLRSIGAGLTARRRDDGFAAKHEVIEGCLLGDGFLRKWNMDSPGGRPSFWVRHAERTHTAFVAAQLCPGKRTRISHEVTKLNGKSFDVYLYRSLVHDVLRPYFDRWYPATTEHQKTVPDDLRLTPTTLLHWFMDDGTTSYRRRDKERVQYRRHRPRQRTQVTLKLCSESFTRRDQHRLCRQLQERFDIAARLGGCIGGTGWNIRVKQSSIRRFFEVIGPCPVPALAYKWKLPSNPTENTNFLVLPDGTVADAICRVLNAEPRRRFTAADVTRAIGLVRIGTVRAQLAALTKRGLIVRVAAGMYQCA